MSQELYIKVYSVRELYVALFRGLRTFKHMNRTKRRGEISSHFIERIMLTVTEVNGCEVCSYTHTRLALEQGMSEKEIKMLLSGITEGIPDYEMTAIFFCAALC